MDMDLGPFLKKLCPDDLMAKLFETIHKNGGKYISPAKLRQIYREFRQWQDNEKLKTDKSTTKWVNFKLGSFYSC